MKQALLLDEVYLKDNSPITANVDPKGLFPFVKTAQDIHIQELIGTSLLNYFLDLLTASPVIISNEDAEAINKCRDTLVWYTVYEFLPSNWMEIRNAGLLKQYSDNTSTVDLSELDYMRNEAKTKAAFYANRLVAFLCANGSKYAAYNKGCFSCGDIAPKQTKSHSTDLFFDGCVDESRETELLRKAGIIK